MINNSGAKQAIVLPNNKNIFLAAEQAVEVAEIPTKDRSQSDNFPRNGGNA